MFIYPVFNGSPTPLIFWYITGLILLIEGILQLSDHGLLGVTDLRGRLVGLGAFWDTLFPPGSASDTLYPAQPYVMFMSHIFLHAGMAHALMNSVILISLSKTLAIYTSIRFVLISMVLGGFASALVFGCLADTSSPMIGASGVAFALIGFWLRKNHAEQGLSGKTKQSFISILLGLVLIHLILHVLMTGRIAWQAHLGGFLTGYFIIPVFEKCRKT